MQNDVSSTPSRPDSITNILINGSGSKDSSANTTNGNNSKDTNKDPGSMCNRFHVEGATESSTFSNGGVEDDSGCTLDDQGTLDMEEEDEESGSGVDEDGNRLKRPPKIWISKSASMEHDLD